jgi:hypothetical protein
VFQRRTLDRWPGLTVAVGVHTQSTPICRDVLGVLHRDNESASAPVLLFFGNGLCCRTLTGHDSLCESVRTIGHRLMLGVLAILILVGAIAGVAFRRPSSQEVAEPVAQAGPIHPIVAAGLGLIASAVAVFVAMYVAVARAFLGAQRSAWGWFWLVAAVVLAVGVVAASFIVWLRSLSRHRNNS